MDQEIWKPINGYEGYYEVSNLGNVRSVERIVKNKHSSTKRISGKNLKLTKHYKNGYLSVMLSKNSVQKRYQVHRLVAEAFIPNKDALPEINHKDENKQNNVVENLEWCDRKYNNTYGTAKMRAAVTQGKSVFQLKNGKPIKAWPTEGMAAMFTGASQSGIGACCRGENKTSGGYGWMWAPWES